MKKKILNVPSPILYFYVYCKYITYSISSTTIKYCIVNLFLNVQKAAIDRTEKCGSEHYGFQDWL